MEADLRVSWDFCWLAPGPVLVKTGLGAQLGPSCIHPEAVINWIAVHQIVCPRPVTGSIWHWPIPKSLPRSQEPTHTVASFKHQSRILQASQAAYPKESSAGTRPCWGEFCFVWSALAQQLACCRRGWASRSAWGSIPHMNRPIATMAQLQLEGPHNHTRDIPGAPSSGDQGNCTTGPRRTPNTEGHPTKTGGHSRST